ncbi:MAG: CHAT domain-containing protein [Planctomycetota bacterium]
MARAYARQAKRRDDPFREAEAKLFLAELDLMGGRLERAAAGFREAALEFSRLGAKREGLAAELGALQAHALMGDSIQVQRRARTLRVQARDPLQAAATENAIGSALDALGDDRSAEESFRRALAHLGRRRNRPAQVVRATSRCNLGIRLARRGAVGAALNELDSARKLFENLGMGSWVSMVRHNQGWALGLTGRTAEALAELRAARKAFAGAGDSRGAALARADEAELALRLKDADTAALQAMEAARSLDRAGANLEAARARLIAAKAHLVAGRRAACHRLARRARKAFEDAGDSSGRALANTLLVEDLTQAEASLRRSGHWIGALDALVARAQALPRGPAARLLRRRLATYPAALRRWALPDLLLLQATGPKRIELLRRAFRAAEELRRLAPTGSVRAASLASHLAIYEELAEALLERGRQRDLKEAFLVLDAVRARTLREEMEREAPGLWDRPELRAARSRLESLWRALERRDSEPGDLRRAEVELLREVSRRERDFLKALKEAEGVSPGRTPQSALPQGASITFAEVRGTLKGLSCLHGRVEAWSCGALADIRADLDAFRFQVNRRLHGARDAGPALSLLERLSRILPPGLDALGGRLDVVLPSELGSLPFEALPVDGVPLLGRVAVAYLPYACARGSAWRRGGKALLVGIDSPRLPEVARELSLVRRRFPGARAIFGEGATRARILDAIPGRPLIHLAGHASAREDSPLLSALRVRDGWITAADLAERELGGSVVVLSACRTGDPSLRWHGESLGGFPRALLAAGAEAIVASRWEIPDETAHAWMRSFYRHLEKSAPDQALARAALAMRDTHPHPADWAGFLLVRRGTRLGEAR